MLDLDIFIDRVTNQTRRNKCDHCGLEMPRGHKRFLIAFGRRGKDRKLMVFCTKTHLMEAVSDRVDGAIRCCRVFEFHAKHPTKEAFPDG